jgi:hypothetical protein
MTVRAIRNIFRAETRAFRGAWWVWNDRKGEAVASFATEAEAHAERDRLNAEWRAHVRAARP